MFSLEETPFLFTKTTQLKMFSILVEDIIDLFENFKNNTSAIKWTDCEVELIYNIKWK